MIKIDGYYFPQFANAGVLLPLDEYAARDAEFMDGFFPHTFMPGHQIYDAVLYGIPNGDSARAMYFNKDMFNMAGIELPTDQAAAGRWDWDAYVEAARKLTRTVDGNTVQWGTQVSGDIRVLINWITMNGGSLLNEDKTAAPLTTRETLGAIEFQRALYQELGVARPGLGKNQFAAGELATMINGIWAAQSLTDVIFEWDAGPLPEGPAGLWSMYKPNSYAISRSTDHPDEAWELIKFLTGDDTEARVIPDGSHEVKRRANARLLLDVHPIPNVRYFLDMIANGRVFSLPVVPEWARVESAFNREWRDIRDGRQDPQTGMIRASDAINAILNPDYWSTKLPLDAPLVEVDRVLEEPWHKVEPPKTIEMEFTRISLGLAITLSLRPRDAEVASMLKTYRDELARITGIRFPNHDTYKFHIGLAYNLIPLTEAETKTFEPVRQRIEERLTERTRYFTLPGPQFVKFHDMSAFKTDLVRDY